MKIIRYPILTITNVGTEEEPVLIEKVVTKGIEYSEENMVIAQREAYGEITVEEVEDEPHATTQADQIAELQAQLKAQQAVIDALLGEE